jgi:acetyl esterase
MHSTDLADTDAIDAEIAQFVAALLASSADTADAARVSMADQRSIAAERRHRWRQGGPDMWRVHDRVAAHAGKAVPVRIMEPRAPAGGALRPVLVYVHGGGFVTFSLETHDRLMREYAARADLVVIGVDYALSPEARFPVALHEVVAVVDWLHDAAGGLGLDPRRIAIGGDSAGANLALSTCLTLRDRGEGDRIAAALFNYGFFDADFDTPSQRAHGGEGKLLTTEELRGYLNHYLGDAPWTDPLALPALASLHDLPPSFHVIASCDPLADGDRAMARRLKEAGNAVVAREYRGATHSFLEAVSISSLAERAFAETADWLKQQLHARVAA